MADFQKDKRTETRGRKRKFSKEEAKDRKRVYDQGRKKSSVNIGAQVDRWNALKESLKLTRNDTLAKILLDRYLEASLMSTPAITPAPHAHWTRMVARSTSESESMPSGIEQLSDANPPIHLSRMRKVQFEPPIPGPLTWQATASTSTSMDAPPLSTTMTTSTHDYSVHSEDLESTAELESFQNHILAYAAKRFAYSYDGYKARCYLAAIDYNKHLDRSTMKNKAGDVIYHRQFSKKAGHWTVTQVKEPKGFLYMDGLILKVIQRTETTMIHKELRQSCHHQLSTLSQKKENIPGLRINPLTLKFVQKNLNFLIENVKLLTTEMTGSVI